jgi:molecular chaperone HscB
VSQHGVASGTSCWSCRAERGPGYFCAACGAIQPIPAEATYFDCLGLPLRLTLDPADLEARFHALSRRFHPDFYQRKSPRERAISLENAAFLNQAYRALRDPFLRADYLLRLERGAHDAAPPKPPPDLLLEVLELQELLTEFKQQGGGDPELQRRLVEERTALTARMESLGNELEAVFRDWDAAVTGGRLAAARPELLDRIRTRLDERSYLRTVLQDLTEALDAT